MINVLISVVKFKPVDKVRIDSTKHVTTLENYILL